MQIAIVNGCSAHPISFIKDIVVFNYCGFQHSCSRSFWNVLDHVPAKVYATDSERTGSIYELDSVHGNLVYYTDSYGVEGCVSLDDWEQYLPVVDDEPELY